MSMDFSSQNDPQEITKSTEKNDTGQISRSKNTFFSNQKCEPYYAWMQAWVNPISKPHL